MIRTAGRAAACALLLAVAQVPATRAGAQGPLGGVTLDSALYMDAARTAWRFVELNTDASTGLLPATPFYHNATTWDLGSGIAAVYSAWRLGIIDDADYGARMDRMLASLEALPLYDSAAYHKVYHVPTGSMVEGEARSRRGYAWSATDLGRFLVWLAILERGDSARAPIARRIAGRMDYTRLVRDGYLWGEDRNRRRPGFQEGRIGYEQYAAAGFALWGHEAEGALDPLRNADTVDVWGRTILRDRRGIDRLASEPFVLMGLELGLEGPLRDLAVELLELQRLRWTRTGTVTIASEDAVDVPPEYFYYYCIYCSGQPFVIETHTPGRTRNGPRWVSTKNAFGWHALFPDEYTRLAVETVAPARGAEGWQSGVFENGTRTTGTRDVNTAAIVLEAALYVARGGPILERAGSADGLKLAPSGSR